MVTMKKIGGIGAIGSTMAHFFHPGDRVREKYPPDMWACAVNVVITGKSQRRIRQTTSLCYVVTIPDVEGECYIVKKNFRVDVSPVTPFECEIIPIAHVVRPDPDAVNHAALRDVVPNVPLMMALLMPLAVSSSEI